MEIAHAQDAPRQGASAHRPGGISFVSLLRGEEDTPGNFHLTLVEADGYRAPRHRHNFDQVRIVLEGAFGYERGAVQDAGTIGYFTEGTYYTQHSEGRSLTLLLQAGGASGDGYLSDRQLRAAVAELAQRGRFEDGVYSWTDATGQRHNQDGYEAAWEHVRGRPIRYPRPRFEAPVLWRPERFDWQGVAQPGVSMRDFASFTEAGLGVAEVRIAADAAWTCDAGERDTLLFVHAGQARCGERALARFDALWLRRGESARIEGGADPAFLYLLRLMKRAT